jgi:hypothetical protein
MAPSDFTARRGLFFKIALVSIDRVGMHRWRAITQARSEVSPPGKNAVTRPLRPRRATRGYRPAVS